MTEQIQGIWDWIHCLAAHWLEHYQAVLHQANLLLNLQIRIQILLEFHIHHVQATTMTCLRVADLFPLV